MNNVPSPARAALRRLIVVLGVVVSVVIFAFGWTVTNINLEGPQELQRQTNVTNALQQLFSPEIFSQDAKVVTISAKFALSCDTDKGQLEVPKPEEGAAYITVSPDCGTRGDVVTVEGFNFAPGALAQIRWTPTSGQSRPREIIGSDRGTLDIDSEGHFSAQIEVPSLRAAATEVHSIDVDARVNVGLPYLSETSRQVLDKMVETVFLALVATALSILPSVIVSFLAARNLMAPVRMSLGTLLVGVALLPLGWWLGTLLLGPVGRFALNLGKGAYFGAPGMSLSFIFVVGAVAGARTFGAAESSPTARRLRSVVTSLTVAVAVVLLLGLISGLGELFGSLFKEGIPGYLSNLIGTLGELVDLLMLPIAGIVGAFTLSSIGTKLTVDLLKVIGVMASHALGGVLGAVCGALLMGLVGLIGTGAALLGLLVPLIAALIGAQILPQLYNHLTHQVGHRGGPTPPMTRTIRSILTLVGGVITFVLTLVELNVMRAIVLGVLPTDALVNVGGIVVETFVFKAIIIGVVLGGALGVIVGTRATFPLGAVLYTMTRTILNTLRSVEPLIMGLVFVIWVGLGPFAGVLALTLHSIASLGKLYSEQLESIDSGPMEALESTGANRLQTIIYGAVPQIIPPYIAFTLYRWDINVRMSTIIGFVGGGGIGFLLYQQINLLQYRSAGVAVLAIAVVVSVLDYASAAIRERYV